MDITIQPNILTGTIEAIPSKSLAHRILICAAFADRPTTVICKQSNQDIDATISCLNTLGAKIHKINQGYQVTPITNNTKKAVLDCGESGSTFRFILPVVAALGIDTTFLLRGRLPFRPIAPLWEELERMGCVLNRPTPNTVHCTGKLLPGKFVIDGSVSSQFISGLLLAAPLLNGKTVIRITGNIESLPYIRLTQYVLNQFGINSDHFHFTGNEYFHSPNIISVEGDWSNAAFFYAANALGSNIEILNLDHNSLQGDRAVLSLLSKLETFCTINVADIPDLMPILSVIAFAKKGAVFINTKRLRTKESDRVDSITQMIQSLGGRVDVTENTMQVFPSVIRGGTVNACADHRIAMSAAIAATVAKGPVTILDADYVRKSYPTFWEDYKNLGGTYEQHIW